MKAATLPAAIADLPEVLAELTSVPGPSATVCPICHTWKPESDVWCENCEEVSAVLGAAPLGASFITLYSKPSKLRDWLTRYKGRPGDEDPWEQAAEDRVEAIVARFLAEHGEQMNAVGDLDHVVVVPSTDRVPPHPLELLLDRLELDVPVSRVLRRTTEPINFRRPNADAYRADSDLSGRRTYLMDDVYTTGAHLNSAAAALRRAGAEVTGALVVARRINPSYRDETRRLWELANLDPFDWSTGPHVAGAHA